MGNKNLYLHLEDQNKILVQKDLVEAIQERLHHISAFLVSLLWQVCQRADSSCQLGILRQMVGYLGHLR